MSWDQSQIRTYAGICRHTALAQVRAAAVRAAMTGTLTLPAAAADPVSVGQDTASVLDCSSIPTVRHCPLWSQPCPDPAASCCKPSGPPASNASP